jgi:two-component system, NarL family, response regulator LiaR
VIPIHETSDRPDSGKLVLKDVSVPRQAPDATRPVTSGTKSKASGNGRVARILIADDHRMMREGLKAVLATEPDLKVVGEVGDGLEAVEACYRLKPDLVLMDVRMPRVDGLEATRRIKEQMPTVIVVILTMNENPDYLMEAIRAGAAGYILKDASGERLVGAVRRTLAGGEPLDEQLAMRLLRGLSSKETPSPQPFAEPEKRPGRREESLTDRELEVLRLLAQGMTNPQIAKTLLYSTSTVKAHVQNIIVKLGVSDRTQAAVHAIELGLATSGLGDR